MKDYQEIKEEVMGVVALTLNIAPDTISEESDITDLSEDSIQLFELLLAFEKKYEVATSYDDIAKLHTVGDIVRYVERVKYSD